MIWFETEQEAPEPGRRRVGGAWARVLGGLAKVFRRVRRPVADAGEGILSLPLWRERRWGGPCSAPPTDAELMEYKLYLARVTGLPVIFEE